MANVTGYVQQVNAMDDANKTKIDTIPVANRKLVTFHDAFPYFAKHYGFEVIGVILENVGQEPSASELAALVQKVKAAHVKAVFSESQFSPELADTLAHEAGISSIVTSLYNDTLGPPPADTYLKMMGWNVDEIVKALR
jgi:zinc/manganese transport system substrate-binding protein/manganese/iron transport system substrate-binding protein